MGAFKDFSPEAGGGQQAAAADQGDEQEEAEEAPPDEGDDDGGEEEEEVEEASASSGGDFPAHTVGGLPALSPTMSQGLLRSHLPCQFGYLEPQLAFRAQSAVL